MADLRSARLEPGTFLRLADYLTQAEVATLTKVARDNRLAAEEARDYLRLLMKHEDVYSSITERQDGRPTEYFCFAPQMLAELCKRRQISLARFIKLRPMLDQFMERVELYYVSRSQEEYNKKSGPLSALKRQFAKRIQPLVSPETPLRGWKSPVSTHHAWHYLRTAQDLVLLKLDGARPYIDRAKDERRRAVQLGGGLLRCGCGRVVRINKWQQHVESGHVRFWVQPRPSETHVTITCVDSGAKRLVSTKDAFQVKRCVGCQQEHRRRRTSDAERLERTPPSRRAGRGKEVKSTTPDKEKQDLIAIKCAWKGCGKTRMIHPQDKFQVKYCEEHQKQHRLDMAKARRAARSKGKKAKPKAAKKAAKPRTSKKALRAPLPKSEPPATEPAPAAEPPAATSWM